MVLRVAERIVFDRSLAFDPPLNWGIIIANPITPIGFSLVQIPAVLLTWWARPLQPAFGSDPYNYTLLYGDPVYTLTSWINPLLVALSAALTFRTAARLGAPSRAALMVAVATALASPLFFYARADFPQPLTTSLMLGVVALLIDGVQKRHVRTGIMSSAVALSILTRPVDGAIIVVVAVVVLCLPMEGWRPFRDGRPLLIEVACGLLVGLAALFVVDFIRFGSPFDTGYPTNLLGSLRWGLIAELVSPGRGLLWYFPLTALAPIGLWALWRRGLRHEIGVLALPVLLYLPIYGKFIATGGWDWGPRYLAPLVPLLALLAGAAVWSGRRPALGVLFGGLGIAGGLLNLANLAVDPLPGFWPVYGNTTFGTDAFWRQFDLSAYPLIGSWNWYSSTAGPDIMWFRLAGSTQHLSVVVFAILLLTGALALVRAWRLAPRLLAELGPNNRDAHNGEDDRGTR